MHLFDWKKFFGDAFTNKGSNSGVVVVIIIIMDKDKVLNYNKQRKLMVKMERTQGRWKKNRENNGANEQLDDHLDDFGDLGDLGPNLAEENDDDDINLDEDEDEDEDGIINFCDSESIQLDDDRGSNSAPGNDVINLGGIMKQKQEC